MQDKPNILFVFSDQQHWQALGVEDSSFETPHLDQLAKTGTVFSHAFCTVPLCSPSRASMLTGLLPTKTGVLLNVISHTGDIGDNNTYYMELGYRRLCTPTIGVALQKAGYKTGYFGKWHLGKNKVGISGWDEDFGVSGPEVRDDAETTKRAISFLKKQSGDQRQPFALFISYVNPHDIYDFVKIKHRKKSDIDPTKTVKLPLSWEHKTLSGETAFARNRNAKSRGSPRHNESRNRKNSVPPNRIVWENYLKAYRQYVEMYDNEFGKVIKRLNEAGCAENTLVVATSDHGDMDTHHRLMYKGPFMYDQLMRVPLIIRAPQSLRNAETPEKTDVLTSNIDLAPTLAEYANTTLKSDGISLKPLLSGKTVALDRSFVIGLCERREISVRMIRTRKYKYNLYPGYGEELFDLVNDPYELCNCADKAEYADIKADLATKLTAWMEQNKVQKSGFRKIVGKGLREMFERYPKIGKILP